MRITHAFLLLLLCASPAAFAQDAPPPDESAVPSSTQPMRQHEPIWTLDVNHDGMISRAEAQPRRGLSRRFDEIDTNHDGQLDRNELRAWHQQMKARKAEHSQQQPQAGAASNQPTMPPPPPPDDGSGG